MSELMDRIRAGEFTTMSQISQGQTNVLITLEQNGNDVVYWGLVKHYMAPGERVLWEKSTED